MKQPSARADVIGGVTTFFTMAYIVVVNPAILSTAGTGMPFTGALTATVLIASSMTLLMGLYARLPFAVAPGMGLNAFFAFTIVLQGKDLDALSDDPDELQSELEALAGPSAGPNGGQIYIDGFTAGQLPPKASIREIRIM